MPAVNVTPETELLSTLRRHWGYDSFRPLQERIVRSLLDGRDSCVVMPTGGGKSLCYQLPAVMLGRTAIVISPLIALMQDQAAQLAQMGIPAAVLNSSLSGEKQTQVIRKAAEGEYRLLYLSPERLARADTIDWLQRVPIAFFAIDEAHCISEWGHEFRPEYRQLSRLRVHFPDRPIAAFTASATRRVRHDILHQLQLRDPHKYIASFHRSNLRYLVKECEGREQPSLLLRALRNYEDRSVIVYAPTIARVGETVNYLKAQQISAIGYHGKMEAAERRDNQERWMSDEVRVLVGTIAFGSGHQQSFGARGGPPRAAQIDRAVLPGGGTRGARRTAGRLHSALAEARCSLAGVFCRPDCRSGGERAGVAALPHHPPISLNPNGCRHRQICLHFGESPKWTTCGACDACGCESDWLVKSTKAALPKVSPIAAPARPAKPLSAGVADLDPALREYLREWRRAAAKQQGVPAFVVMHDSALDEVCRKRPGSILELLSISGFGEYKAALYGPRIFEALEQFRNGARAAPLPETDAQPRPARRASGL